MNAFPPGIWLLGQGGRGARPLRPNPGPGWRECVWERVCGPCASRLTACTGTRELPGRTAFKTRKDCV